MLSPLAHRMRPTNIDEIIGQDNLLGDNGFLRNCINNNMLVSFILYGPPGSGKTTIAGLFAKSIKAHFIQLNAVTSNKKDIEEALYAHNLYDKVIVLIDEVHRLNKDKQDLLLPSVESGQIFLIGATTANPLIAINPAIRSRCHLLEVLPLDEKQIINGLEHAIRADNGLNNKTKFEKDALKVIAKASAGDLRFAYNMIEVLSMRKEKIITKEIVISVNKIPNFFADKDETAHYDAISALQKSIRGSDVDASLYYLARLIAAGDLESIARRLIVTAYEDIGLANPAAVTRCNNAIETARAVGFPEASIPLAFSVCELALSPKSKASYLAFARAMESVNKHPLPPLDYLRYTRVNASEDDEYPYDNSLIWEKMQYLPELIKDEKFYIPSNKSKMEVALNSNYERLSKTKRSRDLKKLNEDSKK